MFHEFNGSHFDINKCSVCNNLRPEHRCDSCFKDNVPVTWNGKLLLCIECKVFEVPTPAVPQLEVSQTPIPIEDTTIRVVSDLFNAHTASIEALRICVESDDTIENKNYEFARKLEQRYLNNKQIIEKSRNITQQTLADNRAIQTRYNELAKQLRAEEREKIKIQDTKYQPVVKPVKPVKILTVKNYDMKGIKIAAQLANIPEQIITGICLVKNITPNEAVHIIRGAGYEKL
jgi:hypothetical protein